MKEKHAIEVDIEELVKSFRATTAYGEDADERDLIWGDAVKAEPKSLDEVLDELENDVNPRVGEIEVGYDFGWEADEISLEDDDLTFNSPTSSPF